MKTITLRNLPREVARRIEDRARRQRLSYNGVVIQILQEALIGEGEKRPREHDDLDFLIGTWSAEESREFDEDLERQRPLDPEIWQ